MLRHLVLPFALLVAITTGCSSKTSPVSTTSPTRPSGAKPAAASAKGKTNAGKLKSLATKTPPEGATPKGEQSSPRVGSVTLPLTSVAVYAFTANVDDDADDEELFWALDGDAVYVWGSLGLACVDDAGDATGEVGDADFVFAAVGDDYGWLTATDACGYSTHFGCSGSASSETCGGCDFDASAIVCAEATAGQ